MRRSGGMVLGGLVAVLATSAAHAQAKPYIFFGGGATIPVSDFKDFAKTGWMATAGVGADIRKGLWVEAEGYYGSNKHKSPPEPAGDKTNLLAGIGALGYSFTPEKKASPYVTAGVGFMSHKFDPATGASETSTKFAYTGALGIGANLSPKIHFFLEGRFLGTKDTKVIPILTGLSINFGK